MKTQLTEYSITELALLTGDKPKRISKIYEAIIGEEPETHTRVDLKKLQAYYPTLDLMQAHNAMMQIEQHPCMRERILHDPACIRKGNFSAKYSLLSRILSDPGKKWFTSRWQQMSKNKTEVLKELKSHKELIKA